MVPKGFGADERNASSSGSRPVVTGCVSSSAGGKLDGTLEARSSAKYDPGAASSSPQTVPSRSVRASARRPAFPAASARESRSSASVC